MQDHQNYIETLKSSIEFNNDNQSFIKVKITPKSPKNEVFWILEDWTIKIKINKIAENWKANAELQKFIKKEFTLKKVEIISWKTERTKLIRLTK